MSKTLIGVVSYGGLPFLEMFLRSVEETLTTPNTDTFVIVAKPGDYEMQEFLSARGISHISHSENLGFPASCNDIYDAAFVSGDYDNVIFCGNDVVLMPGAVDAMIHAADTTDWEMICGSEFNSRFMWNHYPEVRKFFKDEQTLQVTGEGMKSRLWELHKDAQTGLQPDTLKDVRNFTLMKRSAFEKVGYDDVNFWPNGYFCDNCVAKRCHLTGVRAAGLKEATFYHWWSRTIHQGENRPNNVYFERNRDYYIQKWGGEWNHETRTPELRIADRSREAEIIKHWSSL